MKKYIITIDAGTTNTRTFLWDDMKNLIASSREEIGVRNTAIDGNNKRLKSAVKSCLEDILKQAKATYNEVKCIIASGMITSNVGLIEIPHVVAPAGVQELASAIQSVMLEDICPLPIWFIPGVKNSAGNISINNFEVMDIMRGEEVETLGMLKSINYDESLIIVLPGSHSKFIFIDKEGRISGCLTTIAGEILDVITNHTIIADAVGHEHVNLEDYNEEFVLLGYKTAQKVGLSRACFSARILNQFTQYSKREIANYILGVTLQSDLLAIKNSSVAKITPETKIVVAGKEPLQSAFLLLFEKDQYFSNIEIFENSSNIPLTALGAYLVAEKSNIF